MKMIKIILCSTICLFCFSATTFAESFTVNELADTVDVNIGDGTCADISGNCSLRAAIQEANFTVASDTIALPEGTFKITIPGIDEQIAATGDLDIQNTLIVNGTSREGTVISGNNLDRIFDVVSDKKLTVQNLTLTKGLISSYGSAINNSQTTFLLELNNLNVSENKGSAVFSASGAAITDSVFSENTSTGTPGGDLYIPTSGTNDVTISGSTFSNSSVPSAPGGSAFIAVNNKISISDTEYTDINSSSGGGCLFLAGSEISIINTDFLRCNGHSGAGGAAQLTSISGAINVENVTVNDSLAITGGGLYLNSTSVGATISDSEFKGNLAYSYGGLYANANGILTIDKVKVDDNEAVLGGAAGAFFLSSSTIDISGSTFNRNSSFGGSGGGLQVAGNLDINLIDSEINDNVLHSGVGGGANIVATLGSVTILNSDISGNTIYSGSTAGLYLEGLSFLIDQSLISNNSALISSSTGGLSHLNSSAGIIKNTTFSNNTSANSSNIYSKGNVSILDSTLTENYSFVGASEFYSEGVVVSIRNSIIDNSTGLACEDDGLGSFVSLGNNIETSGTCGFAEPSDSNASPLLASLADNGGATHTHALLLGSPAIDNGSTLNCPLVDQRGESRPFDGDQNGSSLCDIGALESKDECLTDSSKLVPGVCGCGIADLDENTNAITDCLFGAELDELAEGLGFKVNRFKAPGFLAANKQNKRSIELKKLANQVVEYAKNNNEQIVTSGNTAQKLALSAKRKISKLREASLSEFNQAKKQAKKAVEKLIFETI